MNIFYLYRKFKADLTDTRRNSQNFNLALHIRMWIFEYILRLDTVKAGFMWTSYPLHQFLDSLNLENKSVLEFGSGGSTAFFLKRKAILHTFEHSQEWINKLKCKMGRRPNWQPLLVKYVSREVDNSGFIHYFEGIKDIDESSLDLVLVDGRHRVECIRAVISKVKPEGYIILDDSDRESYKESSLILKSWKSFVISGNAYMSDFKTQSTVWKKPEISSSC